MGAAISVGEKMASSRNDHLLKQRSVIEFLTAEGCSAVVIHKRMKAVYGVQQDKVKDVVIQHDNALPHTSRQTQCALQQLELPTLPNPPYSPDLAPSDFF